MFRILFGILLHTMVCGGFVLSYLLIQFRICPTELWVYNYICVVWLLMLLGSLLKSFCDPENLCRFIDANEFTIVLTT